MKPISIIDLATACGGKLIGEDSDKMVCAVSTDTRALPKGSLFIALRGDNFDGHDFADAAVENGAICLLVDDSEGLENLGVPLICVRDTLIGLQRLAWWYRRQLNIKVVGITGSNGKTSVKDFTSFVLSQQFKVNATKGNLNNHIGLPLSVLSTESDDEVCVFEMGMNHSGEIAPLCEICAPDIGIITNIGTAHIEFLGSREGIAEEKSALGRALSPQGTLVLSTSCDFVDYLSDHSKAEVIVAGNERGIVRAEKLTVTEQGTAFHLCVDGEKSVPVEIGVSGKHMVNNALLAAAAGYTLGMKISDIAEGLNKAILTGGRLNRFQCEGVTVIDDSYNANPDSVIAAIETLADFPLTKGKRVIVLGVMGELGEHAEKEHLRIGEIAAKAGLQVVSVGEAAQKIYEGASAVSENSKHFNNKKETAKWLKKNSNEEDLLLFKGSRMAGMEQVMHLAFPQTTKKED